MFFSEKEMEDGMKEDSTRKRRVAIAAVLVLALFALGRFLQHPPSAMDVLSGATQKTQTAELAEHYALGMPQDMERGEQEAVAALAAGQETQDSLPESVLLTVSEQDEAAQKYARKLAQKLERNGTDCRVQTRSDALLRAFAKEGKLQMFLIARDQIGRKQTQAYTVQELTREEMEAVR